MTIGKALQLAVRFLVKQGPRPAVAFIGPANRTWFDDIDLLQQVLVGLVDLEPYVVFSDRGPFDTVVKARALELGFECVQVVSETAATRPALLLDVDLLVVFPREDPPVMTASGKMARTGFSTKHGPDTADPVLCPLPHIPMLVVPRWSPAEFKEIS